MDHAPAWLTNSLIYLAAAVIAVPVSRALGLGAILGYLAAGIAIGPWGLRLVGNVQDILHFAEFGVVLMLFLIGLELEPRRLWSLRRPIFGWGSAQVLGERNLLPTSSGQAGFSILLFQDVAALPILALLPLLGSAGQVDDNGPTLAEALRIVLVIGGIVLGGRLALRPLLRLIY
jgi:glutathione-regulated potassium-efflux system ancillary protein KefC